MKRSYKPEFQKPPRSITPPPPDVEPLTPVHERDHLLFSLDRNGTHNAQHYGGEQDLGHLNGLRRDGFSHARLTSPNDGYLARPRSSYAHAHGSPIDTLANAASSLAASPVFPQPSRRPSQPPISPTNTSHFASIGGRFRDDHSYNERPAKRARSEFFPSPQHAFAASRPMTSHVLSPQWNVEEMVDSGTRMYQERPMPSQAPPDMRRLSEAQLLLDFTRTAYTTSVTTQSQPHATNGRSTVYAAHSDMSNSHGILVTDDLISRRQPHYQDISRKHGEKMPVAGSSGGPSLKDTFEDSALASAVQTHTPPDDAYNAASSLILPETNGYVEMKKTKPHQGWPKGKPRGPRTGSSSGKKRKVAAKVKTTIPRSPKGAPDQLQSPQSLPTSSPKFSALEQPSNFEGRLSWQRQNAARDRRHSASDLARPDCGKIPSISEPHRALSVPPDNSMTITAPPVEESKNSSAKDSSAKAQRTICAGCNFTSSTVLTGESQDWIRCDGCNDWFHFACAGFQTARDVRGVDKYFCRPCKPTHGPTTYVRKSTRAHSTVDYAGLNEGVLRTSDENPEHHYIRNFKDGTYQFDKDTFARMPPELVNLEYFEKMNGFREPIVIPASLNPRPKAPGSDDEMTDVINENTDLPFESESEHYDYESVQDDGQDKLDMVIPQGLTVRRVAEMYGLGEPVEVIDVKSQSGEPDKKWDMKRWADYYEEAGEKIVRNVISLEVSKSKLGRLIRRPKVVRDMDLQDSVWPEEDKANAPKVQFYCLMSVADCYTDFHIDFGGSSVYYHIVKGKKTFFFIPPTKQNLKKYEDWCLSPAQNHTFLAHQVKECYRVDLSEGDTMLIPAGWIHAVWTPENSLVIGGNFLTRLNYGMQIRVFEVEKATKVARKFRYPNFQKVLWLTMLKYLDDDPLPQLVANLLSEGKKFERQIAIYCESDRFGHNSHLGTQYYNSRYYSKAELDGLPDLANYIWRTVMISLGQIEGITQEVRNAVKRSIPKGRGDPLELVKKFAMWTAWKRGNEEIPQWAHPQALLLETGPSKGEAKLSAAALKKLERKSWSEAFRASRDRPSRQMPTVADTGVTNGSATSHPLAPTPNVSHRPVLENGRHLSTPKTSQLGPKRIACDACRKRRIRCKHKDALTESQKIMANSSPIMVSTPLIGGSSLAGAPLPPGQPIKLLASDMEPVASVQPKPPKSNGILVAEAGASSSDFSLDTPNNKSGRVKACLDCRKSKRRCIHDEHGRVDPVKASEAPVPRGSATKKRKHGDDDASPVSKKVKGEPLPMATLAYPGELLPPMSPAIDPQLEEPSYPLPFLPELRDSITVSSLAKKPQLSPQSEADLRGTSSQVYGRASADIPSTLSTVDPIVSSIEQSQDDQITVSAWERQSSQNSPTKVDPVTPRRKLDSNPRRYEIINQSSPLSDAAQIVSPAHDQHEDSLLESVHVAVSSTHKDNNGRKMSHTPRPLSSGKGGPPTSAGVSKSRRDSKGTIKVTQKARTVSGSSATTGMTLAEEEANARLIKELQASEYSLRRRSK